MICKSLAIKKIYITTFLVGLLFWVNLTRFLVADVPVTLSNSPTHETIQTQTIPLWKRSFEEIKEKAEAGDAYAQAVLAFRYRTGSGIKQNYVKSLKWSRLSKEKKNIMGIYNLAMLYINGLGISRNQEKALDLFSLCFTGIIKLAEKDDAMAQTYLGMLYMNGIKLERNGKSAILWLDKAANKGFAGAQTGR